MTNRDQEFREFVAGSHVRLLRLAYLLVGDRGTAEDLLQDTFERLYVKWARVQEPEAYARRALANGATNRWRTRSRKPEVPLDDRYDSPGTEPEHGDREVLMTALKSLPSGQRSVVVLRYFEDLSVEQVAAALGCSTGTVKSQTARALPRLRSLLTLNLTLNEETVT